MWPSTKFGGRRDRMDRDVGGCVYRASATIAAPRAPSRAGGALPVRVTDRDAPVIRATMIMFRYQMRLLLREPIWVVITMVQPLLYMALFAPLLRPIADT